MEKEQTTIGLSREFIIHPGETLQEILEDREMSQKELSVRTGVTEKHISTIINGAKPISVAFAKKLEYALGFEAAFWINLQALYDRELLEFEELHSISDEEISVLKNLKDVIVYLDQKQILNINDSLAGKVLDVRKFMGISNLLDIPNLVFNAAFRAQVANTNVDVYVLFAWQKICELLTHDIMVAEEVDTEKLKSKVPEIKKLMFEDVNIIQCELERIFAECGIGFRIVKNFKGAPVQGFIKKTNNDNMILCMTLRGKYADKCGVRSYIVIGRLMKEQYIGWDNYNHERDKYIWVN
ncbi:MAG: HigA family addiction module antitoxin [Eubacteriales bacterium]